MPKNLELKARVASIETARDAANRTGARFEATLVQTDTYFKVPYGRLKLREISGRSAELIYYDRTEKADERWSTYTRLPLSDARQLHRVLANSLGVTAVVRKTREVFRYQATRIHLDQVEGLGTFIEFEVQDSEEAESRNEMEILRVAFGVVPASIIRTSYADMLMERANPR